jgi:hypothetical protein
MSSTEPEDDYQLPLPLGPDDVGRTTVVSIDAVPRTVRTAALPARGVEPVRSPLTEAEVAHRRAMLAHLTRQSA